MPGVLVDGLPEAPVSTYRFSPLDSRPAGFTNVVSCKVPTCDGALVPAVVTETVPSRPTVIDCALAGMVMAGWTTKPDEVTSWPLASLWNEPSRV